MHKMNSQKKQAKTRYFNNDEFYLKQIYIFCFPKLTEKKEKNN